MASKKNPLNGLAKFYEQSVAKTDKAGFADIFKQSTFELFERIKKEVDIDLHFEDVNFGDGYFIFGYGTNSTVNFHIKEAPGWLGGIWWFPIETEETKDKKKKEYVKDRINCVIFFQYEDEIDKFKPTASMFGGDYFDFYFEGNHTDSAFLHACWDLKFIIKEPYLINWFKLLNIIYFFLNFNNLLALIR